jgi:hypothetical protein
MKALILALIGLASSSAFATSDCSMECGRYQAATSPQMREQCRQLQAIQTQLPPGSQPIAMPPDCDTKRALEWAQVGQLCDSYTLLQEGASAQGDMTTTYTAAAVACGVACAISTGTLGFGAGFAETACKFASVAAGGMDVFSQSRIVLNGKGFRDAWGGVLHSSGTLVGAGAALVATGVAAMDSPSCIATGLLAAAAGLHVGGKAKVNSSINKNCNNIKTIAPADLAMDSGGKGPGGPPSPKPTLRPPGIPIVVKPTGEGSRRNDFNPFTEDQHSPITAQLTSGPVADLMKEMQNKQDIPRVVKEATGMTIGDLNRELESKGPGEIVAAIKGIPAPMADFLRSVDQAAKDGKLADSGALKDTQLAVEGTVPIQGGAASSPTRGGAAGGVVSTMDFNFGGGAPKAAAAPSELSFDKHRELEADGDVWHTAFPGTIFQIVTHRLNKSRDRVANLEWASPLNRALVGLPNKPLEAGRLPASDPYQGRTK